MDRRDTSPRCAASLASPWREGGCPSTEGACDSRASVWRLECDQCAVCECWKVKATKHLVVEKGGGGWSGKQVSKLRLHTYLHDYMTICHFPIVHTCSFSKESTKWELLCNEYVNMMILPLPPLLYCVYPSANNYKQGLTQWLQASAGAMHTVFCLAGRGCGTRSSIYFEKLYLFGHTVLESGFGDIMLYITFL